MPIKVLGLELQALFDTGSEGSVMSTEVWNRIPEGQRPALEPYDRSLNGAGGHPVRHEGVINLLLEIDGYLIRHDIIVAAIVEDIILGTDFLVLFRLNWDYARRGIMWPENVNDFVEDSGSGDVSPPEVSVPVEGVDVLDTEDFTEDELEPDELQDMEVLPYVPRGMVDMLSRERRSLEVQEDFEEIPGDVDETPLLVGATQLRDSGVDDMPSQIPEYLAQLYTDSREHLSPEQQSHLAGLLEEYKDVFSRSDTDLGRTKLEVHRIPTGEALPIRFPPRSAPIQVRDDIVSKVSLFVCVTLLFTPVSVVL